MATPPPPEPTRTLTRTPLAVSAVIPCYNAARWLRPAIESALAQTRPVAEVIVVDDGSRDASCAIAAEYPVRLLATEANSGQAAARNVGLRMASHDVVAWLDADDWWDPQHCAIVVPLLEAHAEAAVAFSAVREAGGAAGVWRMPRPCDGPARVEWNCFERTIVPAMSAVTRRQAALDAGGFRESLRVAPDFDFWLRLALKHPFVWTCEVTASYRQHDAQISRRPLAQLQATYRARALVAQEAREAGRVALAHRLRARTALLLDDDLRDAWWRGDMARLRALLAAARSQRIETAETRKLRRLARVPSSLVRQWRAVQAALDARR